MKPLNRTCAATRRRHPDFLLPSPSPPDFLSSPEGVPVARGLGADPVPVADRPAEDGVLVAVQLRLGHHEAGVVLRAAVLQTCAGQGRY